MSIATHHPLVSLNNSLCIDITTLRFEKDGACSNDSNATVINFLHLTLFV